MQLVGTPNVDVQADATLTTDGVDGMTNGIMSMSGPGGDASGGATTSDASGGESSGEEVELEKEEEKVEKDITTTNEGNGEEIATGELEKEEEKVEKDITSKE